MAQSGVGIMGTVLNSFVLWIFWKERQSLNTSINTMTRLKFRMFGFLTFSRHSKDSFSTIKMI